MSRIHALIDGGISSTELGHRRLGHPSNKVVQSLPFIDKTSIVLDKACDVCHQAKQCRNKFPISNTRAATCRFEIIDCDLWGKYHTPSSCGATYFLTLDDYSKAVWVYLLFDKI